VRLGIGCSDKPDAFDPCAPIPGSNRSAINQVGITAGLLSPVPGDAPLPRQKRSLLDRLYQTLTTALDRLTRAIGLAPSSDNENKIPVGAPLTA
jgi:hypothetical protein